MRKSFHNRITPALIDLKNRNHAVCAVGKSGWPALHKRLGIDGWHDLRCTQDVTPPLTCLPPASALMEASKLTTLMGLLPDAGRQTPNTHNRTLRLQPMPIFTHVRVFCTKAASPAAGYSRPRATIYSRLIYWHRIAKLSRTSRDISYLRPLYHVAANGSLYIRPRGVLVCAYPGLSPLTRS